MKAPITVGTLTEVNSPEFVPVHFCDELLRMMVRLELEVFCLELDDG